MADEEKDGGDVAVETSENDEAVQESEDFDKKLEENETAYEEDVEVDDDDEKEDDGDDDSADTDTEDEKADDDSGEKSEDDSEKKSAISDELLRRAERLGLDADEAKAFKSQETLTRILDTLEGTKRQPDAKTDTAQQDNPFKFKVNLDKDVYDEGLIGQLESINDHYASMFGALFNKVGSLMNQRYTEQFDGMISGLGEDWHGVFGKGSHGELDPTSSAFRSRAKLDAAVTMIQRGRESLGKPPLSPKEAFEKALHAEFHDVFQRIKDGKISKQMKQNKRQIVGRGSRVKGKPLTGHEQAVQISRDFDSKLEQEGF